MRRFWLALAAGIMLVAGTGCDKTPDKPRLLAKTTTVQQLPVGWNRFDNAFANHPTWTFMPSSAMANGKHALMVVLHGCNQTFDQLKQFGNLENAATKRGILLAVPDVGKQHFGNDIQRCWNYDQAQDNNHHMAEIIQMTETLADSNSGNNIDRNHIYIVGLSSGGALALDIACKRPDLFAGVGSVAGPSVGSMQGMATNEPFDFPQINLPPGLPPIPMLQGNVVNATNTCKSLAASTGTTNQLDTQVASIAAGDMDKGSPSHNDRFPFQAPIDQTECNHAGQVALIPFKWGQDNVEAFRNIYGTDDLGGDVAVQGGLATMRVAAKNGKARISFLTIRNVGHAWPAGKGTGTCTPSDNPNGQGAGIWIAQQGLDYPEFITNWLMANNARGGNPDPGNAKQKGLRSRVSP
jgi:poly(hydroxyalkanoate) depolymerase family esterase